MQRVMQAYVQVMQAYVLAHVCRIAIAGICVHEMLLAFAIRILNTRLHRFGLGRIAELQIGDVIAFLQVLTHMICMMCLGYAANCA